MKNKKKLLIFIVAYNAKKTISKVLSRIPQVLNNNFNVEILIIDDSSTDSTFSESILAKATLQPFFLVTILKNPINQGYGGNQKIGYHYAIKYNFDYVALIHGDGQYAPECLPDLLEQFNKKTAAAIFGSRMLSSGDAIKGGMPIYKYIGNKILTRYENIMLDSELSEFHSGYRIYLVEALKKIPFSFNTNDFHFDTEIIIQLLARGLRILEYPIPTYYGDEICHVDGLKYARNVFFAVLKFKAQKLGIFYDRRFDLEADVFDSNKHYQIKLNYLSPHTLALNKVPCNSNVLDLGCAEGYIGWLLKKNKNCFITGVDQFPIQSQFELNEFIVYDLSYGLPENINYKKYDYILLLDIVEHLLSPEKFVDLLYKKVSASPNIKLLVSTGNVGFFIIRFMLLFGQFNYGKRGILDITHSRLFTFASLRQLFIQSGFEVQEEQGVPFPFFLVLKNLNLIKSLNWLNIKLISLAPRLFSYQIFMVITPRPSLNLLLENAVEHSKEMTLN